MQYLLKRSMLTLAAAATLTSAAAVPSAFAGPSPRTPCVVGSGTANCVPSNPDDPTEGEVVPPTTTVPVYDSDTGQQTGTTSAPSTSGPSDPDNNPS